MTNDSLDTLRKLMELHALEDRLQVFKRSKERTNEVQALIESLRASISLPVLLHHDRFRARSKRSVAEVRGGVCSGCHMAVAIGRQAALKRQDALQRCDHCGRFLYLVEQPAAPEDADPVPRSRSLAAATA